MALAGTAPAAPALPPAEALAAAPLPAGGWLALLPHALALGDGSGRERARIKLRSEHLQIRAGGDSVFAAVLDADTQALRLIDLDPRGFRLSERTPLPSPQFTVETFCLYRDADGLISAFLLGEEGQAEQWALERTRPRLIRTLALPVAPLACAVDDASDTLYVAEDAGAVWAYHIEGERTPSREAVALSAPFGDLGSAVALAALPGGLAVLDADRHALALYARDGQSGWLPGAVLPLRKGDEIERMLLAPDQRHLLLRDEATSAWQSLPLSWTGQAPAREKPLPAVSASVQTEPVARFGDAADDPAIWVNRRDPSASRVLGTNKKQGLLVYDLNGKQRQWLEVGRLNNVDVRQDVRLDGSTRDIAVATQRDDLTLMVFEIDASGVVREAGRIPTALPDIYGVCLYQPSARTLHAIVNDKDGRFEQYQLSLRKGVYAGRVVGRFKLKSQPEGCVADDARKRLFVGEEARGVWSLAADPADRGEPELILATGPLLHADVEGLAIYADGKQRYLVVSSQGNDSYVVLDAEPPFRPRGAFRIGMDLNLGIDGAQETDGLEVLAGHFGPRWPQGLLVVQDGFKRLPDGPQNFKLVSFAEVLRALKLQ